jgi:uncharacterized protein
LWITFLISKQLDSIDSLLLKGHIKLIFSQELIEEFLTVSKRSKFSKFFSDEKILIVLKIFDEFGKLVNVTTDVKICRDYKDNFLLNLAIDSKADYLITGDNDLLVIKKIKNTRIMTWIDFVDELK